MSSAGKQRILVAPLDWGLGHATRCTPLIDRWLSEGHEVIVASNGRSAAWLKQRYPQLEVLTDIPDYAVTYPANGSLSVHFAKHLFRLLRVVREENNWLKNLVESRSIQGVYSDNRYGLYHERIPCTLITHQLYVRVPWWAKTLVSGLLNRYFKRFQSIWVPDYANGKTLSGALSHAGSWDDKVSYIGPLSRMTRLCSEPKTNETNEAKEAKQAIEDMEDLALSKGKVPERSQRGEIVALLSGPEPSRTAFEQQLRQLLADMHRPALLVLGKPDEQLYEQSGQLTCVNHLPDEALADALKRAPLVICRSGYSTLMDLDAIGVRALLVPTSGQTEQEYLANYHEQQGNHYRVEQKHLTTDILRSLLSFSVES